MPEVSENFLSFFGEHSYQNDFGSRNVYFNRDLFIMDSKQIIQKLKLKLKKSNLDFDFDKKEKKKSKNIEKDEKNIKPVNNDNNKNDDKKSEQIKINEINNTKDNNNEKEKNNSGNENEIKENNLTSQRLFLDMKDWLSHGGKEQIVLREWDESLTSEKEFRCFVKNNELKAICQDERYAFWPDLVKNKNIYEKIINDFFNNDFKHRMKIPDYIVDFAVLKNNQIKLIEFSPYLRCTSARLFRWDNNYEEMLNGKGKLSLRMEPHPDIEMFVQDWENDIKKPSEHFDDYFIYDNTITSYLSYFNPFNLYYYFFSQKNNKFENKRIFVVSVLKQDFYWSKKYITYEEKNNSQNSNKLI